MTTSVELLQQVDEQLKIFTFGGYHNLVDNYQGAMLSMMMLYVISWGYKLMMGKESLDSRAMLAKFFMISACYMVAVNFDFFSTIIYDFCTNAPDRIAAAVSTGGNGNTGLNGLEMLDTLSDDGYQLVKHVVQHLGLSNLQFGLYGLVIVVLDSLMTAIAMLYIISSKMLLAICLSLTPLFAMLFIFSSTRAVFNGWLQVIVTSMVTPIIIYSVLTINYLSEQSFIAAILKKTDVTVGDIEQYLLLTLISEGLKLI